MFELAWYLDYPHKTVIGIHNGPKNDIHKRHPFVQKAVTTWVENTNEAVDLIRNFFGDMFNK